MSLIERLKADLWPSDDAICMKKCGEIREAISELEAMQAEIDRYRNDLSGIANAVRLGAASDVQAWANLANACQQTARASLGQGE